MGAWPRRFFLKSLGLSAVTTLVLAEVPHAAGPGAARRGAGPGCGYGAGSYGSGVYAGFLAAGSTTVLADKSSNDLVLTWTAAGAVEVEIWRSDRPFTPGDPGAGLIATTGGNSFVDPGALAAPGDLYYVARARSTCE